MSGSLSGTWGLVCVLWGGGGDKRVSLLPSFDTHESFFFFLNKQTFRVLKFFGASLCLFPPVNGLGFGPQLVLLLRIISLSFLSYEELCHSSLRRKEGEKGGRKGRGYFF